MRSRCPCKREAGGDPTSIFCSFTCSYRGAAALLRSIKKQNSADTENGTPLVDRLWTKIDMDPTAARISSSLALVLKSSVESIVGQRPAEAVSMVLGSEIQIQLYEKHGILKDDATTDDSKEKRGRLLKQGRHIISNLKRPQNAYLVEKALLHNLEGSQSIVNME